MLDSELPPQSKLPTPSSSKDDEEDNDAIPQRGMSLVDMSARANPKPAEEASEDHSISQHVKKLSPLKKAVYLKKLTPEEREAVLLDSKSEEEKTANLAGKRPLNSKKAEDSENSEEDVWASVPAERRAALQAIFTSRVGKAKGLNLEQFGPVMLAIEPNMTAVDIEEEFSSIIQASKPGRRDKPLIPPTAFAVWAVDLLGDLDEEDWQEFWEKTAPPVVKTAEEEAWDELVSGN